MTAREDEEPHTCYCRIPDQLQCHTESTSTGTLQWFSTKAYNHENQLTKPSMKAKRINETQKRRVNLSFTRLLCLVSD